MTVDTSSREYVAWVANVWRKNIDRHVKVVHDMDEELDPKPLLRKVCYTRDED